MIHVCKHRETVTTVRLVSVRHLAQLRNFFLVMRTFKISLSDLQSRHTASLTAAATRYLSEPGTYSFVTGRLCLLTPLPVSPTPAPTSGDRRSVSVPKGSFFWFLFFFRFLDSTYE